METGISICEDDRALLNYARV